MQCTQKKQPETSKQPPGDRTLGAAQKYLPRSGFNPQQGSREFMNLTAILMWSDYQQPPLESTAWTSDHKVTRLSVEHLWLQGPMAFSHSSMMLPKSHSPPNVTDSVQKREARHHPLDWRKFCDYILIQLIWSWSAFEHRACFIEWGTRRYIGNGYIAHGGRGNQSQHGWTGSAPFWKSIKNSKRKQSELSETAHLQMQSAQEAALQAAARATSLKPFKIRVKRYCARAGGVA